MKYVGALTLSVLLAPTFALYAGVSLDLALELTALVALSASIGISIPNLTAQIALAVQLSAGIQVAVDIGLPSVSASLGLALSAQLVIIEGLLATLSGILAIGGASIQAYTYSGPGSDLGIQLTDALTTSWPDGTPANDNVEALVLAATSSGTFPVGELASLTLLGGGGGYERGLCSVSISGSAAAAPTINPSTGAITGFTISSHGSGYVTPPTVSISDTVNLSSATNASPIVVTIADTTDVTAVTISGVQGNTAANGQWCAKVLSGTTIALYADGAFTVPSVGNGPYTGGGTVTGNGGGAAAVPIMGGGSIAQLISFFSGLVFGNGLVEAGSIALSSICQATFDLLVDLQSELELEASLLASATLNFGIVPPTIAPNLTIVGAIDANLTAALDFQLPSIQASLLATVNGRAQVVLGLIAAIGAQLNCATENLLIFTYSGPGAGLGAAVSSAIGSGWPDSTPASAQSNVVILGATTPAATAALSTLFPAAA